MYRKVSFECRMVNGFALLRYMIGLQNSRHFFIQSELKPTVARSHMFSRALPQLRFLLGDWIICTLCDWSLALVLGHSFENRSIKTFSILTGSPQTATIEVAWTQRWIQSKLFPGLKDVAKLDFDFDRDIKQNNSSARKKQFVCNYLVIIELKIATGQLNGSSDQ